MLQFSKYPSTSIPVSLERPTARETALLPPLHLRPFPHFHLLFPQALLPPLGFVFLEFRVYKGFWVALVLWGSGGWVLGGRAQHPTPPLGDPPPLRGFSPPRVCFSPKLGLFGEVLGFFPPSLGVFTFSGGEEGRVFFLSPFGVFFHRIFVVFSLLLGFFPIFGRFTTLWVFFHPFTSSPWFPYGAMVGMCNPVVALCQPFLGAMLCYTISKV